MLISNIAIRRPMFTSMVILAMIVFGIVSLKGLGVDLFPKIDFPVISVVTTLRGADPETMESRVSDVLEQAVNTIAGIKTLRSTSAEGYSLVMVEFQLEKNIDVAYQEVQSKINSVRVQLPTDADDPIIEKFDPDSAPIMTLVVSGQLDDRQMYHLADQRIKERLQRVPNVGNVKIVGGRDRKFWLWLDGQRLQQHHLTVRDVSNALLAQHVEMPGGRIETGSLELVTRTKAEFHSAAEMEGLIIAQSANGGTVYLRDVGTVEDGLEELRSYSQRDDKPSLALQIRRQSGTNTVQVSNDLKSEIAKLERDLKSEGITLDIAMDSGVYIQQSINEVYHHLVVGGLLAVFTVLIFLLNFRSTFISAMVLPTSILATFMMMSVMGFTLNFMTLMALTLAIGLLIDDAIVVQENIMRHVQEGKPARFAAAFATNEIGLAVLATTLSVVAVFMPTAYTKGIVGRFFFPFGMTISFAVLISMFVSFTLDPMLSSRMLKKQTHANVIFRFLEQSFLALERLYERVLRFCIHHRVLVVIGAVLFFVGSLGLLRFVKADFLPKEDRSEFEVSLRAPLGSSLSATRQYMEKVRAQIKTIPELNYTFYTIGGGDQGKVNEGSFYVRLFDKAQRQSKKLRGQFEVMDQVRRQVKAIDNVKVTVQPVNPMGGAGMKTAEIQYELLGPDLNTLDHFAQGMMGQMRQWGGYTDVDSTYETGRPESSILVNRQRAAELGVSPMMIADTIRTAIGGVDVAKFRSGKDRYDIAVRFLESGRNSPEKLLDLWVPTSGGASVQLSNVASVQNTFIPVEINRFNRQRQITLLANLDSNTKSLSDAITQMEAYTAQNKLSSDYSFAWTGNAQDMRESFANLGFTMLLSVIVTYMVLAAQFESPIHPLTIMLSLPLAFVGAIGALLLTGQSLSIFAMMAFIFLLGLVTKNAILLIDYANTLRQRDGMERDAAMCRAGPVRLRPILMTTFAMIFGMLPSALGTGEGAESRRPMAVAILGGLISSTVLTLLIVPVVYSLLDPISEFFSRKVLKNPPRSQTAAEEAQASEEEILV